MAEVLIFHHVQGLTDGLHAIADEFRSAGHVVKVPDLFDGRKFDELADGVSFVGEIGRRVVVERALAEAEAMQEELVYVGFSLGARPAQMLAQTRRGARGALLFHGFHPCDVFADDWPEGVLLQVHLMDDDEWCDPGVAATLKRAMSGAEVFNYPGSRHLFTDSSVDDYEPDAAALAIERALEFLDRVR